MGKRESRTEHGSGSHPRLRFVEREQMRRGGILVRPQGGGLLRRGLLLCVALLTVGGLSDAAADARRETNKNAVGTAMLKNGEGMCLNQHKKHVRHGKVHMWLCGETKTNAHWAFHAAHQQIRSSHGVCLHAEASTSTVGTEPCDMSSEHQKWQLDTATGQ